MSIGEKLQLMLEEVTAERDALAAHVERLHSRLDAMLESGSISAPAKTRLLPLMQDKPTTSLARLKAEWQAEAFEYAAENVAPVFRRELRGLADRTRRQAEPNQ